jgi:predicted MFS family arabinose efflux permease
MRSPRDLLRPLRSRNYRFFFGGQGLSLIGSFVQSTALAWVLYGLAGSPLQLGGWSALMQLPVILLLPLAGSLADRFDRRRLLIAAQVLFLLQTSALAWLAHSGQLTLFAVVAIGIVQGVVTALDGPPRLALVPRLVDDPADLPAAISLNSALFNSARSIGPPIAGFLLAGVGAAACFALNAASYLFVLAGLLAMRLPAGPPAARRSLGRAAETLAYVRRTPELRDVLAATASLTLVTMSVYVLLPVWARDVLGAGPQALGFLGGGLGLGSLAGALIVGSQVDTRHLARLQRGGAFVVGAALILFAFARTLPLSVAVAGVLGFAFTCQSTAASTLLQLRVSEERRAGVMSFLLLATYGSIPIGHFAGGALASWLGPPAAALAGGVAALAVAARTRRDAEAVAGGDRARQPV